MRNKNKFYANRGFTLVELLTVLLITGILMMTIISVFLMSQKIYIRGESISYKQKSITNVETDLQNALSRATSVALFAGSNPNGDYILGFNSKGQCVEVMNGSSDEYTIDQISQIILQSAIKGNAYTMNYDLNPKTEDSPMSTLSGGIIMNNIKSPGDFKNEKILDKHGENYLVVNY